MYELKTLALAHHKAAVEETVFADSLKNCHRQPMGHSALFYCLDLYLETNAILCLTFAQHISYLKRESRYKNIYGCIRANLFLVFSVDPCFSI